MIELAGRHGVNLKAVILTHTDVDHIAGLPELIDALGPFEIAVHDAEKDVVMKGKQLRRQVKFNIRNVDATVPLVEGVPFRAGSLEFEVPHTPGHSPGGACLRSGDVVVGGHAPFAGSTG